MTQAPATSSPRIEEGRIITIAQMRAIDAASAAHGVPIAVLMENAGRAVAEAIMQRISPRPCAVLCGPGANGGDGWVAARHLRAAGWPCWVETLADPATLSGEAAQMAGRYDGPVHPLGEDAPMAELFVDALFGAGLTRPLEGQAARLAKALQTSPDRVVAVDVPSGLHGDTGQPLGGLSFAAGLTVTFIARKPAHVLAPGRALCGEVVVADIADPPQALADLGSACHVNAPASWMEAFPWPGLQAHKHARGHAMVVSGGPANTGAARLAAISALRVGAGLVTVLSPPSALLVNAAHLTAVMLKAVRSPDEIATVAASAQTVVIGPAAGITDHTRQTVLALAGGPARLVIDADAISVFAEAPDTLFAALRPTDVLTPHVGEFRRLFPGLLENSVNRIEAARAAAERAGAVVLLKGADTAIAAPDSRVAVNVTGAPFLATAGSGDVLAGVIAGLIAQAMPPFEAACAGAYLHGRTGEICGPGLIAEDLPAALPQALRALKGLTRPD